MIEYLVGMQRVRYVGVEVYREKGDMAQRER